MRKVVALGLLVALLLGLTAIAQEAALCSVQTCSVQVFFVSPSVDGVIERVLIALIGQATSTLDIALYYFTDDNLGDAVVAARARNVKVRVLLDGTQEKARGGEYEKLVRAGIEVSVEHVTGKMHHKFVVIDREIVVTGSYNWSSAADTDNLESIVVIECPEIAAAFIAEFDRIWSVLKAGQRP